MIKIKNEKLGKSCFFFHNWKTVKNTGLTKYQVCEDCDSRQILQQGRGYQPINFKWVAGVGRLNDELLGPPPPPPPPPPKRLIKEDIF